MANTPVGPRNSKGSLLTIIGCILAFGMLMGLRSQFQHLWVRTLIAGGAGAFLGVVIFQTRNHWRRNR